jgi:hypothetical protein
MRTQRVNLCPECLEKHKRGDTIKLVVTLLAIAAVVLFFVLR